MSKPNRKQRKKQRRAREAAFGGGAAMADLALLLLVFFMTTSSMGNPESREANLPVGPARETRKNTVNLSILSPEKLFVNEDPVRRSDMASAVLDKIEPDRKTVAIYADQEISYGDVADIIDELKAKGLNDYLFAVRKEDR